MGEQRHTVEPAFVGTGAKGERKPAGERSSCLAPPSRGATGNVACLPNPVR